MLLFFFSVKIGSRKRNITNSGKWKYGMSEPKCVLVVEE
jgi:hypothetical protein